TQCVVDRRQRVGRLVLHSRKLYCSPEHRDSLLATNPRKTPSTRADVVRRPVMTGNARRNTFDIVVVGGGIGGLAAAHALARHGYQVCVLERAPQFGEVGAGLQLGPNATRLLDGWGLLDAVAERGVLPARLVLRDALDGQELTSLDLGEEFRQRYHAPYIVVHRTDLHAV